MHFSSKRTSLLVFYSLIFFQIASIAEETSPEKTFQDIGRIYSARISKIVRTSEAQQLQEAVRSASEKGLKVSIAGKRHSQGGHVFYDNAVVLDMLSFNKILNLDEQHKVITVQSGATWEQVQEYANAHGLAVKVMQASNIFTVGGSLGSNVHGNDPSFGPIIETVRSFRLLMPDGSIQNVSRTENPELFSLAIGGFGLFGVILDVDLELTDNDVYKSESVVMDYKDYPAFFQKNIAGNARVGIHSAKLSIAPESLLAETATTTYVKTDKRPEKVFELQQEKNVPRNRFLFGLSRISDWGKSLRWGLQKKLEIGVGASQILCRNNVMRPIVKFLEYRSDKDSDILQEYFVPKENLTEFLDGFREIVRSERVNLTSVTLRHVPKNEEAFLSYAKRDSFAVVLYINQKLDPKSLEHAEKWTRQIVDLVLKEQGTYYLTYQLFPSGRQIRQAYPELDSFFEKKKQHDPKELFMNKFYERYSRGD